MSGDMRPARPAVVRRPPAVALARILGRDLLESARDLAPVVLVVAFFQVVVLRQALPDVGRILVGALAVVVGLALFVRGLRLGLFPIGEQMARGFARRGSLPALVVFAFALGFSTTVAEPALIAIAASAAARSGYALGLRLTVAVSVGVALVIGVVRIIKGWPIRWFILGGYVSSSSWRPSHRATSSASPTTPGA